MEKLAFFVDAGYFWVQLSTILYGKKEHRNDVCVDYLKMRNSLLAVATIEFPKNDVLRVYWYDGARNKTSEQEKIECLDNFKLRLGYINTKGHQKAVDGLIITDLIGLAQNKAISDAVIVSGDADLVPGVVTAQSLGVRVARLEIGPATASSPALKNEVDSNIRWDDNVILSFASKAVKTTSIAITNTQLTHEEYSTSTPTETLIVEESEIFSVTNDVRKCESTTNTDQDTPDTRLDCTIIASLFFENLTNEKKQVLKQLSERAPIPKHIDSSLLAFAKRQNNNTNIPEKTKKELRACLKHLAATGEWRENVI